MRDTKDASANSAPRPITAESIVKKIIGCEPLEIRENLHDLMCTFFMYHEGLNDESKNSMYSSYRVLVEALTDIENLRKERELSC
jgi:hypothetical protein